MTKDATLDRLKAAQDLAYQRKQTAYDKQQRAWEKRSAARESMNRAYEVKQRAYAEQDRTWQRYQLVRNANGPRIDTLTTQQQTAYDNQQRAFGNASSAYDRRDGAGAASYAAEGHRYKAESQGYVAERRRLVDEIKSARAQHEATKPAFQRAKDEFNRCKRAFETAKAEHERAVKEFQRAKAESESATKAFRSQLEKVKAEGQKRRNDKKDIAAKAGVPHQYRDNVWISKQPNGTINIYFGGVGKPNGPGHGHYAISRSGEVTYRRDPYDPHGAQNFTNSQRDYESLIGTEAASDGEFGFYCRFRGYDAFVESNTNQQGRAKIDIYYGPNGAFGPGHHHAVAYRESPYDFVADNLR